jgi:hypothetical protein
MADQPLNSDDLDGTPETVFEFIYSIERLTCQKINHTVLLCRFLVKAHESAVKIHSNKIIEA